MTRPGAHSGWPVRNNVNTSPFLLGNLTVGSGSLFLIAGPCVIESETHAFQLAGAIREVCASLDLPFIFKPIDRGVIFTVQ